MKKLKKSVKINYITAIIFSLMLVFLLSCKKRDDENTTINIREGKYTLKNEKGFELSLHLYNEYINVNFTNSHDQGVVFYSRNDYSNGTSMMIFDEAQMYIYHAEDKTVKKQPLKK